MLRIVADENIPGLDALMADVAEISYLPGRTVSREDLLNCDVLLVRSVTRVDKTLLEGTPVRFVGSCTIGTDHIDLEALSGLGIAFAHAPGCNAEAVADYVISALFAHEPSLAYWQEVNVGIVGLGNVGSALKRRLLSIGVEVLAFDPFKAEATHTLEEVLSASAISFHVPLTKTGDWPTWRMISGKELEQINDRALLINSSRGPVIDNQALASHLERFHCVLDVYEDEPEPLNDLLEQLFIATPHIAGYSIQGKLRGSSMVVEQLRDFLELPAAKVDLLSEHQREIQSPANNVSALVKQGYDIAADSERFLAQYLPAAVEDKSVCFDQCRKTYPLRLEYGFQTVIGGSAWAEELPIKLGFAIQ